MSAGNRFGGAQGPIRQNRVRGSVSGFGGRYDVSEPGAIDNYRAKTAKLNDQVPQHYSRCKRCSVCQRHKSMLGGTLRGGFGGPFVCFDCKAAGK